MIKTIDQQLFERRLMRNLEKFVEGREYGNDFRCLNRRNDFVILCPSLYQVFIPTVPARPEGLPWDIPIDSLDVLGQSSRIRRKALPMLPHMYGRFSGKAKLKNLYDLNNAGREKFLDSNWKLHFEHLGGLLASIHGLFSGRYCGLVRTVTCGIVLNSVMHLSHMFYADDAVFMGQWSTKNIDTIIYVLKCFHRASGLSINLSKSKLLGVVVSEDRVVQAANRIGCGVLKAPFAYLGSKVGGNMSRIKSWDEIVDKMVDRLSKWKMKTLSIGGRLTLLKAVLGSMPIYHMSIFKVPMKVLQRMESIRSRFFSGVDLNSKKSIWVKWSKVLCSKEKGGLGVSSLYALNRALMCKWVWRFTTQKNLLWTRVIKAIHGEDGKNGSGFKVGYKSIWRSILQEVETLKIKGIHLNNFMQKKLGNGADTYFWEDLWHGDMVLKQRYPRLYALEVKKTVDVASKLSQENLTWSFRRAPRSGVEQDQLTDLTTYVEGVVLGVTPDRWYWTLDGSGEFSVASARKVIDDNRFPEVSTQTRWIKAVPIKVNIHAWKVRMDCLPTRLNISRRGIDIPSILCPVCGSVTESSSHLFFDCLVAKDNFRKICRWWEVDFMEVHTFDEWVSWIVNLRIPIKHKRRNERSLYYNNSFLNEYECSSLALDREEKRDEKEEIESLETRSNNVSDQEI
ncbi:RNA-directed DNA polymerase, eukaryota, reverse transcriptase zinc-binding domain protein [Tanacetum coccineum]|uniref:RNA-directed DNA polymerase, eukaryota, reverse transcriptase zinc-binding domain protein n=1 Tax=Tanacetum coccineum TaxID=301880 RepID=A0ABQ4WWI7_9ASTR